MTDQGRREQARQTRIAAIAAEFLSSGPLAHPLVFGDTDQREAIRRWSERLSPFDESGHLRQWEVTYTVIEERTVVVEADSEDEARELAEEESGDDIEDIESVRELDAWEAVD